MVREDNKRRGPESMINSTNVTNKKREKVIKDYEVVWGGGGRLQTRPRHGQGLVRDSNRIACYSRIE